MNPQNGCHPLQRLNPFLDGRWPSARPTYLGGPGQRGARSHPSFPLLPPATALYLYKPTGNGVRNQLAGNFWMQKVTCCLAAAQQAGLDFDSFNPKRTGAARLFFPHHLPVLPQLIRRDEMPEVFPAAFRQVLASMWLTKKCCGWNLWCLVSKEPRGRLSRTPSLGLGEGVKLPWLPEPGTGWPGQLLSHGPGWTRLRRTGRLPPRTSKRWVTPLLKICALVSVLLP